MALNPTYTPPPPVPTTPTPTNAGQAAASDAAVPEMPWIRTDKLDMGSGNNVIYGSLIGAGIPLVYKGVKALFGGPKTKEEEEKEKRKSILRKALGVLFPVAGGAVLGSLAGNYLNNSKITNTAKGIAAAAQLNLNTYNIKYPEIAKNTIIPKLVDRFNEYNGGKPDMPVESTIVQLRPNNFKDFIGRLLVPSPVRHTTTVMSFINPIAKAHNLAAHQFNRDAAYYRLVKE